MKNKALIPCIVFIVLIMDANISIGQWAANGSHIYNTNSGFVGIGNNSPSTLLYVAKNMTEPAITVQNLGGVGGATYRMVDDVSGADWKFKTTITGGFKIRDHANTLDVLTIEANSAANVLYINSAGSIGMGTASPAASAALDITSTDKGFLPPRMTESQIMFLQNPANGLVVWNTDDGHIYVYTQSAGTWKQVAYDQVLCGSPFTVTHTAGSVAPVTKTVTYGTVLSSLTGSDKCWITQNLGADHQATSATDATEASSGWYWQFNRQQGYKHDGTNRTPNTAWIYPINQNSNWVSSNDPCTLLLGTGWRLPTIAEWNDADYYAGWDNIYETYNGELKIHGAGRLVYNSGTLEGRGVYGMYWSSMQADVLMGWQLYISNTACFGNNTDKGYGLSARCLKD